MSPLEGYLIRTVLTLLAVSGLAVLVLWSSKRSGLGRAQGPLNLAGRLSLDARRSVYLVRVGTIYYVVGASEAGLTKLGELSSDALGPLPETSDSPPTPAFRELLQRLVTKTKAPARPPEGGS